MALSDYPERPKVTKIPWGYYQKDGEQYPPMMAPLPEQIMLLDQSFDQLDAGIPIRRVMEWFEARCLEIEVPPLSMQGVHKLWNYYRPDHPRKQPKPQKKRQTHAQRSKSIKKSKLIREKISFAAASKRIQKLSEELQRKKTVLPTFEELTPKIAPAPVEDLKQEFDVIFEAHPGPQERFLASEEREVLYGGAAGGGKSFAMLADPLRYFDNENFNGILLRRTNDELRELIWKSQDLYSKAFPGAKWSEKRSSWTFPSGGHMWFTYLERDDDVRRYQGQAFCWIGFDELTQYPTQFPWDYLRSRLRSTDPALPLMMRATSNPGGPGHGWVKRMFIDPAPYEEPFIATDIDTGQQLLYPEGHAREGEPLFYRKFIPARVQDNPSLWNDGQYEANLLSLPENQRRQLLEGDWNVADGAAFPEFRQSIHVCKPYDVPSDWRRFRSCDYGYASHSAVHWFAINPVSGQLVVYRELYCSRKTGIELGHMILEREQGESISYGVLDSATWAVRGQTGPSVGEEILQTGCRFRPTDKGPNSRAHGLQRLHELLKVDPQTGEPGIIFFDKCRQIITDLPVIPTHPDGKDDIDDRYTSDHAYDSVRYGVMSRPRAFNIFDLGEKRNAKPLNYYQPSSKMFGY